MAGHAAMWLTQPSTWLTALAVPAGALALLGYTASWWFPGELASHWTLHAGAVLLALWALWFRRGWPALVLLVLAAAALAPWVQSAWRDRAPVPAGPVSTVVSANLYTKNPRRSQAWDELLADEPDLLAVEEALPRDLDELSVRYQHVVTSTGRRHGMNILASRWPLRFLWSPGNSQWGAAVAATWEPPWGRTTVVAIHSKSPTTANNAVHRDEILLVIAQWTAACTDPVILLGDANCTHAVATWDRFLSGARLMEPPGPQPGTWPDQLGPFGIGIDHLLVRGLACGPVSARAISGSDHRTIQAQVGPLPPPAK